VRLKSCTDFLCKNRKSRFFKTEIFLDQQAENLNIEKRRLSGKSDGKNEGKFQWKISNKK